MNFRITFIQIRTEFGIWKNKSVPLELKKSSLKDNHRIHFWISSVLNILYILKYGAFLIHDALNGEIQRETQVSRTLNRILLRILTEKARNRTRTKRYKNNNLLT